MVYELFLCSTNIPRGLSAYNLGITCGLLLNESAVKYSFVQKCMQMGQKVNAKQNGPFHFICM